jgi:hypothetical protein
MWQKAFARGGHDSALQIASREWAGDCTVHRLENKSAIQKRHLIGCQNSTFLQVPKSMSVGNELVQY